MSRLSEDSQMDQQGVSVQNAMDKTDHKSSSLAKQEEVSCNPAESTSIQEAGQDTMSSFMKTPLEIRNQIYEYLLSTKYTKVDFVDEEPGYTPGWPSRSRRVYHFHPAILAVNRQIHHEAGQVLRENLFVKLMTDAPEHGIDFETRGLPVVAESDSASRVTYSTSELTLSLDTKTRIYNPSVLLFAGDDMTIFCRVLLRSFCRQSSLSIAITSVAPTTRTILKLLEPFRRLDSMVSVRITGKVEVEYKTDLIAKMMRQAPGMDTFVQEVQDTMKQGDLAAINKDCSAAKAKYTRALEDLKDGYCLHDSKTGYCLYDSMTICQSGTYNGQSLHTAFVQTMLNLSIKIAITYLKRKSHSRAHKWIHLALAQINPFRRVAGARPGGAGCAIMYSIAAAASEGLGLVERATEEMKEAVRHDPGDSKLTTELDRLEKKTQNGVEALEVL